MRIVSVKIDDKLYEELEKRAKEEGFLTIAEYVRSLIMRELGKQGKEETIDELPKKPQAALDRIVLLLERRIQDKINPFTSKVDELSRKTAEIVERIEGIEQKILEMEERLKMKSDVESRMKTEHKAPRKTAIDILKEQKVIFERDIASRIKDRDSFFARLEQSNAKVIEAKDERIAVDPDFWENFTKKILTIGTNNDDEIRRALDSIESRLFYKLKESALVVYDNTTRKWHLLIS
ncbi:MAG: ribbon-helix-helix domain-containing protein [Ignisphaera sp.]|nr:ribbon-helix-helix domain-containing protein [Ignisphaera sp.]MCX8168131.1 ribbon-helix-helix domain-containing protein [Ignisphaera sp.]MDW8085434.1 ribbon-helix-helix protein, CopG family [Ignisphaera sp.]